MAHEINGTNVRIRSRDAAMRLLNRLTAGVAFAAIGGVGMFAAVSAHTFPATISSISTASSSTGTSTSTSSSSLQSSSTPVSSSSSSGVAVSGGS